MTRERISKTNRTVLLCSIIKSHSWWKPKLLFEFTPCDLQCINWCTCFDNSSEKVKESSKELKFLLNANLIYSRLQVHCQDSSALHKVKCFPFSPRATLSRRVSEFCWVLVECHDPSCSWISFSISMSSAKMEKSFTAIEIPVILLSISFAISFSF